MAYRSTLDARLARKATRAIRAPGPVQAHLSLEETLAGRRPRLSRIMGPVTINRRPRGSVITRERKMRAGVAAVLVASLLACDGGSSNPVGPSALGEPAGGVGGRAAVAAVSSASPAAGVPSAGGVGLHGHDLPGFQANPAAGVPSAGGVGGGLAGVADPGLPQGDVGFKAMGPALRSPADEATVDTLSVQLEIGEVRADFEAFSVDLRIQVWAQPYRSGAVPQYERVVRQAQAGVRHTVPDGVLADETSYLWRAQAVFDDENGRWSEVRAFDIVLPKIGVPNLRTPTDGMRIATLRPTLTVSSPPVTGNVGDVFVQFQVARNRNFTGAVRPLRAPRPDTGDTSLKIEAELAPATRYYWRARGVSDRVTGGWSAVRSFSTSAVKFVPPTPVTPGEGQTVDELRPTFRVNNPTVTGVDDTVIIELQIARTRGGTPVATIREAARSRGNTDLRPSSDLNSGTRYYWRARGVAGSRTSGWSAVRSFQTPRASTSWSTAPGRGQCCPPPNRFDIVQAVLRRTGNLYRNNIQQFTERVAECLAATDGDWGRRRNDSGRIGKDTVAYRTTKGPGRGPYSIDIMAGAESDNPRPHWYIQEHHGIKGRITGTWIAIDGGKCVL